MRQLPLISPHRLEGREPPKEAPPPVALDRELATRIVDLMAEALLQVLRAERTEARDER